VSTRREGRDNKMRSLTKSSTKASPVDKKIAYLCKSSQRCWSWGRRRERPEDFGQRSQSYKCRFWCPLLHRRSRRWYRK
jgi:hypothetical protein